MPEAWRKEWGIPEFREIFPRDFLKCPWFAYRWIIAPTGNGLIFTHARQDGLKTGLADLGAVGANGARHESGGVYRQRKLFAASG
jgi:hypothetical protein